MTASFDASRTSFVREGSFRGSSTCGQQGGAGERDEKAPDKKKGSGDLSSLAQIPVKNCKFCIDFLLQTSPLQFQPSRLALPLPQRARRPPWNGRNLAGLTPSPADTRPSSSWCVKARSGDFLPSARRTPPSRGSCRSVLMTCRRRCSAKPPTSRPRTLVS